MTLSTPAIALKCFSGGILRSSLWPRDRALASFTNSSEICPGYSHTCEWQSTSKIRSPCAESVLRYSSISKLEPGSKASREEPWHPANWTRSRLAWDFRIASDDKKRCPLLANSASTHHDHDARSVGVDFQRLRCLIRKIVQTPDQAAFLDFFAKVD